MLGMPPRESRSQRRPILQKLRLPQNLVRLVLARRKRTSPREGAFQDTASLSVLQLEFSWSLCSEPRLDFPRHDDDGK